jgi:protocatechuate 3,4-dioxygenase beta subunit
VVYPEETAGPFPGDGSNDAHCTLANVLERSGIVRRAMRNSLGAGQDVASGTPLDLTLSLVNVSRACAPLAGYAIYLWHCDSQGRYSIYDLPDETYLRAVGVTNAAGKVQFTSIFPGCYAGRYPHMHFEVYASLEQATSYRNRLLTSQIAMPADACHAAYNGAVDYKTSITNFARTSLEKDSIFADNTPKQLAAQTAMLTGDTQAGYRGHVVIGISV